MLAGAPRFAMAVAEPVAASCGKPASRRSQTGSVVCVHVAATFMYRYNNDRPVSGLQFLADGRISFVNRARSAVWSRKAG